MLCLTLIQDTQQSSTHYYSLAGHLIGELSGSTPTTSFFMTDALGSILATFSNTAGSAAMLGNQLYGPYGNQRYQSGSMNTNKGFTGQYNDPTSGLDYYISRYYDPVSGVFLSADQKQGNVQGVNPYAYVGANPETDNDPTGEMYAPPPTGEGTPPPSTPPSTPPASTPWWQQLWNVTKQVSNTAAQIGNTFTDLQFQAADFLLGISSMGNDLGTLFNGNSSIGDKFWAGLDLGINAGTDIALLFGVGELIRGGELAFKGGDLALKAGEDIFEHGGEQALEHFGETALDDGGKLLEGGCSFTASTAVMTASGKQAIGTLHPGEKVLAYNPKTHKMELQPILHVWIDKDNDLVDLTVTSVSHKGQSHHDTTSKEVIHTNKKHPFLTKEKGFLPVGQIKLGMHVLRADGQWGLITGWKVVPGTKVMYNLEVAQDHTFTVGAGEWVVHNCGGDLPNGWEKLDYGADNNPAISDFTHIDEAGNRLEATFYHDLGELHIPWMDSLNQAKTNLPGLIDWLGDSVDVVKGYVTDNLATHFSPGSRGLASINRMFSSFLDESGFSPGAIESEGSRTWIVFRRLEP